MTLALLLAMGSAANAAFNKLPRPRPEDSAPKSLSASFPIQGDPAVAAFYKSLNAIKDRWQAAKQGVGVSHQPTLDKIVADLKAIRTTAPRITDAWEVEYPLVDMLIYQSKTLLAQGEKEKSALALDEALRLYPGNSHALQARVLGLVNENKVEEAHQLFQKQAVDYASGAKTHGMFFPYALETVVNANLKRNEAAKALANVEQALGAAKYANKEQIFFQKGKVLMHLGKFQEAYDAVTEAQTLRGYNLDARFTTARFEALSKLGRTVEGLDLMSRLLPLMAFRERAPFLFDLVYRYKQAGAAEKAREALLKYPGMAANERFFRGDEKAVALGKELGGDDEMMLALYAAARQKFDRRPLLFKEGIALFRKLKQYDDALKAIAEYRDYYAATYGMADWFDQQVKEINELKTAGQ